MTAAGTIPMSRLRGNFRMTNHETYKDHPLITVWDADEEWRIVRRDFCGIRVLHGEFEEWPVLVPYLGTLNFATYEFDGKRSMPDPRKVPETVRVAVGQVLGL